MQKSSGVGKSRGVGQDVGALFALQDAQLGESQIVALLQRLRRNLRRSVINYNN
jgi:hypothetical protein